MLQGKEPGEKQRMKKSTLSNWLQMLQGREPDEKQRRKKGTLSDWLQMLPGRETCERKKTKDQHLCCQRLNVVQYHTRSTSSTMYRVAFSGSEVDHLYEGAVNSHCGFCGVLYIHSHKKSINCCHSRKVSLPPLWAVPTIIHTLLTALQTRKKDVISVSTFSYTTVFSHLHLWGQL